MPIARDDTDSKSCELVASLPMIVVTRGGNCRFSNPVKSAGIFSRVGGICFFTNPDDKEQQCLFLASTECPVTGYNVASAL